MLMKALYLYSDKTGIAKSERKVNKLENCHVEVLVTVDEKAWKDAQEKAYDKLSTMAQDEEFKKTISKYKTFSV